MTHQCHHVSRVILATGSIPHVSSLQRAAFPRPQSKAGEETRCASIP
jgi:hypothetical protein